MESALNLEFEELLSLDKITCGPEDQQQGTVHCTAAHWALVWGTQSGAS